MSTNDKTIEEGGASRRDFLHVAAASMGGVGAVVAAWPFIDQMNPAADTLAVASTEVDLSKIAPGEGVVVKWRGKPVFVRHRTEKEIEEARAVPMADLRDKQTDAERVHKGHAEWLVVVGICTHLGCVPLGTRTGEQRGEYGGWFCPCHGSQYDTAGRIRKGPAPLNLAVPEYTFLNANTIKIG
ncbi:ubiquinol-cytochrome c reductase iron-sulfur subunit [Kordiimonas marina]|uniref:ubiquinol-cytochrome c reductase iron-sulfur subunit n=1 Tax=Kordiimonas marina TaxID=2872312 RepID=UPI001FF4695E|nr:ubiquinol-cytochrome c reductase iron-sulfur subunit [Kordiimonas marina]MCJ9427519.1 ubiquinol-cytochrome c reductase iron-sulfur subunit [Kordiimonas marina]